MTDHEIDLLVIKTITEIIQHITFEEEDGLCVAGPALDALRDAFKKVREGGGGGMRQ
jgi:hypothetical protein